MAMTSKHVCHLPTGTKGDYTNVHWENSIQTGLVRLVECLLFAFGQRGSTKSGVGQTRPCVNVVNFIRLLLFVLYTCCRPAMLSIHFGRLSVESSIG